MEIAKRKPSAVSVPYRDLLFYPDSEAAYVNVFGAAQPAFWLDSSLVAEGLSRFSFMGACTPENGEFVSYDQSSGKRHVRRLGLVTTSSESIFSYLSRRIAEMQVGNDDGSGLVSMTPLVTHDSEVAKWTALAAKAAAGRPTPTADEIKENQFAMDVFYLMYRFGFSQEFSIRLASQYPGVFERSKATAESAP